MDSKDKESIYYKEIRDLVNKNTFDKVLECTFKIYNNEFSVKGTNEISYTKQKISNIIRNQKEKINLQEIIHQPIIIITIQIIIQIIVILIQED